MEDGVLFTDINGNILKVNEKFEDITGFSEDEVLGKNAVNIAQNFVDNEELEKALNILNEKSNEGDAEKYPNLTIETKEGKKKFVNLKISFTEREDGRPLNMIILDDITDIKRVEKKLEGKNNQMKTLLYNLPGMAYRCLNNKDYTMKFVSEGSKELTGYEPEDLIDNENVAYGELIIPEDRDKVWNGIQSALDKNEPFKLRYRIETAEGEIKWVWEQGREVTIKDGNMYLEGFITDITERKKGEEKIKHLNSLLKSISNVNKLITQEEDILELMRKSRRLLMETRGYSRVSIFLIDDGDIYEKVGDISLDEIDLKKEELLKIKDPSIVSREKDDVCSTIAVAPLIDNKLEGILAIENLKEIDEEELGLLIEIAGDLAMAVNKIKAEKRLKRSLREKEILLDEIHHRVKNNLQVISSLLKLQASEKGDKDPLKILQEGQNRIQSMALIHEMLHRSDDIARIELKAYIRELVRTIYQTYNVSYGEVELETDMEDIALGIDQANPCVQVITEIISNSLQHAFPEDYEGKKKLKISTTLTDDQIIEIVISDNGVGIPKEVDLENSSTFGFRLIHMLVLDQLDGEVEVIRDEGTTFKIRFRKEEGIASA